MKHWRNLGMLLLTAVILLQTVLLANPVSAAAPAGLTVSNAILVMDVLPGQTVTWPMSVSISAADRATTITVQIKGMTQSPEGSLQSLPAAQDNGSFSARPYITVDNSSFPLDPGNSQTVTAYIRVPQNVGAGQRYAIINIATSPQPGVGVNTISAVDVPIYLTVKNSQIVHTGKITGLSTNDITTGQPIIVATDFLNTGNDHFKIKGEIDVTDPKGQIIDTIGVPTTTSNIMPGLTRHMETTLAATGTLSAGTYTVDSKIMLDDGTLLDKATTTFKVTILYVPPPGVGIVKLLLSSPSTLRNDDSSIFITFPQGAAVVPVEVSLQNYTDQLPALPSGHVAASTCFQVNGLTGLLAKDATLKVKYTTDDLSKAGGNAAKLQLLRWDPSTNQWVVLKTKVDTKEATLTANSDQMGLWTVASGTVKSSSINWTVIGIPIAVVIIVAIVGTLLINRGKRRVKPAKR